jgi:hypothetical protein
MKDNKQESFIHSFMFADNCAREWGGDEDEAHAARMDEWVVWDTEKEKERAL